VLDADARDVREHPDRWISLLGDLDDRHVRVQWVGLPDGRCRQRDRFLGTVGDFRRAKRLVTFAATGQR